MTISPRRLAAAVLAALFIAAALPAAAQVNTLWYKEASKDGRIYVFNNPNTFKSFEVSKEMGVSITKPGYGPNGETVVFENENAIDLFNLKHGKDSEIRTYAPPKPPVTGPSTTIKIGDSGELKFGLLLQAWYVTDDSTATPGVTDWLGNTAGENTFRLRRAEIKLNGKITPAWGFEVMIDPSKAQNFTGASNTDGKILQDLAVVYLGVPGQEFALGQKKIVITEEGVRSSSELDFAERAQVTRAFSDVRQTGFFYKGEYGESFGGWASITNGTVANSTSDTNDTLFFAGRFDYKPIKGMLLGASGGTGATSGGQAHREVTRYGAHFRWDGTADLPLWIRAEYLSAKDGQANGTTLNRDGFYVSALYTFLGQLQLGARYDTLNNNKDCTVAAGCRTTMITGGVHYLVKGKNLNLKLDYFNVKQEGRVLNGVSAETYNQFVLAAQAAF